MASHTQPGSLPNHSATFATPSATHCAKAFIASHTQPGSLPNHSATVRTIAMIRPTVLSHSQPTTATTPL